MQKIFLKIIIFGFSLSAVELLLLYALETKGMYLFLPDMNALDKVLVGAAHLFVNCLFTGWLLFLKKWERWPKHHLSLVLLFVSVFFYLLSWGTYILLSSFLLLEGVTFFAMNVQQFILHLMQPNLYYLFVIFMLLAASMVSVRLILESKLFSPGVYGSAKHEKGKIILCLLVCLAVFMTMRFYGQGPVLKTLKNSVSPLTALLSDLIDLPENFSRLKRRALRWEPQRTMEEVYPLESRPKPARPVILILVESLRSDAVNARVMPRLTKLLEESHFWPNAFTTSSHSDYADMAVLSSHFPLRQNKRHRYPKDIWYPRVLIYDVLKAFGYKTAVISAQNESWGNMQSYLKTGNLDFFFDAQTQDRQLYLPKEDSVFKKWADKHSKAGKLEDQRVIDQAIEWISGLDQNAFFIYMNLQRSHFPYTWPDTFDPPFEPFTIDFPAILTQYDRKHLPVMLNRYNNSLRYIDQQIARFLDDLKAKGLYDESLVVITGDTAQAFFEHGTVGHAGKLYNEVLNVPIIIKAPKSETRGVSRSFVQHVDIAPTVCDILRIKAHPAFQGGSLLSAQKRPIYLTVQTSIAQQDAVISDGYKYVYDFREGRDYLFNLKNDFDEKRNLAKIPSDIKEQLKNELFFYRDTQLKFYSTPLLYKNYYPPKYFK